MEKFLSSSINKENSISIIGENEQVFQIILKKNESIIVNSQYISYASSNSLEETPYNEVNSLINLNKKLLDKNEAKVNNNNIVRLKNVSNNIEYIGLSKGGKIMKILPLLYNNLFIRLDSLLAFSESNDTFLLVEDYEYQKKVLSQFYSTFNNLNINPLLKFQKKFVLIKDLNKKFMDNLNNNNNSLLTISEMNKKLNEYLYLSGEKMLIEKRLGEGEQIVIMKDGLIAFEKSVSFYKVKNTNKNTKYVNSNEDIIIEGPGLIIFESINRKLQLLNKKRFYFMVISLIVITVIETIIQFRTTPF